MAEDQKMATLVRGDETKIVGVDTPEAQQAFGEGFKLPEAPDVPTQPDTPTDEAPVVNRGQLLQNVQQTFDKFGGDAGANEAFIRGAVRLAGREATDEDLAQGGTVGDVINRLGLGDQLSGFGITAPELVEDKPEPGAPEIKEIGAPEELSLVDKIRGIREERGAVRGEAMEEAGVQTASERLRQSALNVQAVKNKIAQFENFSEDQLEAIGDKPIPNVFIQRQQAKLSEEQQDQLRDLKQDYNNALVIQSIEQGAFARAEDFAKQIADDMFDDIQDEIDDLILEESISQEEGEELKQSAEFDREMALGGFVKLSPSQLTAVSEDQILRVPNPITGVEDIFKKPETLKDRNTQVIKGLGGRSVLIDKDTGEIIRDFQLGGGGGGGGDEDISEDELFYINEILDENPTFVTIDDGGNISTKWSSVPVKLRSKVRDEVNKRSEILDASIPDEEPTTADFFLDEFYSQLKEAPTNIKKGLNTLLNLF